MFDEDLDAYLADHGVLCSAGGHDFIGILDAPGQIVSPGKHDTVSQMYSLLAKASDAAAGGAQYGAALTVDGKQYKVREVMPQDDGVFVLINLSKV